MGEHSSSRGEQNSVCVKAFEEAFEEGEEYEERFKEEVREEHREQQMCMDMPVQESQSEDRDGECGRARA